MSDPIGRRVWAITEGYSPSQSGVIRSLVPVVVQHTRLDSRQAALTLLSIVAWAG